MVASDVADAPASEEELAALAERLDVAVDEIEAAYRSIDPSATDDDLRLTINADLWFVLAGRDLADVQSRFNPRTYRYLFAWPSPAFGGMPGAPHGIELPFVFDHFEPMALFLGDDPPAPLAKAMQEAWVSFARNGAPVGPHGASRAAR